MKTLKEAKATFDDPDEREESEKVCKEPYDKSHNEYATPEAAETCLDESQMEFEGDLNCLEKHFSEGLWAVGQAILISSLQHRRGRLL